MRTWDTGGPGCLVVGLSATALCTGALLLMGGDVAAGLVLLALGAPGMGLSMVAQRRRRRLREEAARARAAEQRARRQARGGRWAPRRRYAAGPVTATSPLPRHWHERVQAADAAVRDIGHLVEVMSSGPLRDRIADALPPAGQARDACGALARRGAELERLLRTRRRTSVPIGWHEQQARAQAERRLAEVTAQLAERLDVLRTMALHAADVAALQSMTHDHDLVRTGHEQADSLAALAASLEELGLQAPLEAAPAFREPRAT